MAGKEKGVALYNRRESLYNIISYRDRSSTKEEEIQMEYTEGVRFDSLGLSPEIMRAIEQRPIEVSTPVQAGCIPPMMDW